MDLVTEQIFEPLEMTTAGFRPAPNLERHLAAGYVVRRDGTIDSEPPAREHGERGYKVPNGAVYSSVYDLAKFIGAMSGVLPLLSETSRREMLRIQTPESPTRGYSLGFSIVIDSAGNRIAGHGGSVAGYNATIQFDPDARIGVVILRGYNGGQTNLGRTARETVVALREAREAR
jgi:CubicO group peptidase (beta-lactamase class C family)